MIFLRIKTIIIVLFLIGIISIYYFVNTNNKKEIREYKEVNKVNSKRFKMFIQQENGEYIEKKGSWPGAGYILNEEKTICTDGYGNKVNNKIEYKNGKIEFKTNSVIYCNIYFDIIPMLIDGPSFYKIIPSGTTKIIFTDEGAPSSGVMLIDLSNKKDYSIVGWSEGTTFKISNRKKGEKVIANTNSSYMFYGRHMLEFIDLSYLDIKYVTSLNGMFFDTGTNITSFKVIGLDEFNTSSVADMSWMFSSAGENAITFDIGDLSNWDTSSVTDMSWMFYWSGDDAVNFDIGNLSNWNTSNVVDMSLMFNMAGNNSKNWNIGDISKWDTSKVIDMERMFTGAAENATSFNIGNLSNWDTSNVKSMFGVFSDAGKNANWYLDCSKWNVSKVTEHDRFNDGVTSKVKPPIWVN